MVYFFNIKIIVFIIVYLGIAVKLTPRDGVCVSTIDSPRLLGVRPDCGFIGKVIYSRVVNLKKFLPVKVALMHLPAK